MAESARERISRLLESPYTASQLKRIAAHLHAPLEEMSPQLERAARRYLFNWELERSPENGERNIRNRSARRKAYLRVARNAESVIEALRDPAYLLPISFSRSSAPNRDVHDDYYIKALKELISRSVEAANAIPARGGAEPKTARLQFVSELAELYFAHTGKVPTRTVDPITSKAGGMFFELVELALRALNPHALSGVEADIRKVAKTYARVRR